MASFDLVNIPGCMHEVEIIDTSGCASQSEHKTSAIHYVKMGLKFFRGGDILHRFKISNNHGFSVTKEK